MTLAWILCLSALRKTALGDIVEVQVKRVVFSHCVVKKLIALTVTFSFCPAVRYQGLKWNS